MGDCLFQQIPQIAVLALKEVFRGLIFHIAGLLQKRARITLARSSNVKVGGESGYLFFLLVVNGVFAVGCLFPRTPRVHLLLRRREDDSIQLFQLRYQG
jgi:hypothetical protein